MKAVRTFICVIVILLPLLSVGQQRWEVNIGNPDNNDVPKSIINSMDGGNIINNVDDGYHMSLYKTDRNGDLLWKKTYQSQEFNVGANSIFENSSGLKVLVGILGLDGWIMLLDACGNKQWCHRYDNNGLFYAVEFFDVLMEDSVILVSAFTQDFDNNWGVYLLGFDYDGNLLWDKPLASHLLDPLLMEPIPAFLKKTGDAIFIVGDCYYAYPDNPNVFHLRSMFIKLDSLYNKEWFLPYGMPDHLVGTGFGVIQLDSNEYRGYGRHHLGNNIYNSIFMDFDKYGNENQYKDIPNDIFSPNLYSNSLLSLNKIGDTAYYITAQMDTIHTSEDVTIGEFTVDTSGNAVYNYQIHYEIIDGNIHPSVKTSDGQFVTHAVVRNDYRDILLYKLNADLSQAGYDTSTYVYDSLCTNPITSDTIFLEDCSVVTSVNKIPIGEDYYSFIKTIPVDVFPNPATSDIVFEFGNTGLHKNIRLACFDINGKLVFEHLVQQGRTQIKSSVANWQSGIYIAVASSSTGGTGSAKFIVK